MWPNPLRSCTHIKTKESERCQMKCTIAGAGHYVATTLLVVLGLSIYGCGDTATVNPEVQLAGLEIGLPNGAATLNPAFNPATTNYTADLTSDIQSVKVTALPAVSGDSVTINGQATTNSVIPLNEAGKTTIISVSVLESDAKSRTYTVVVNRAGITGNNSLRSLTVSPGTLPPPGFDPNTQTYAVDVASSAGTISVTPTLQDLTATVTVNGQAATSGQPSTVTLGGPGSNTRIDIVVTAQNNSPKIYTVNVNRGGLSSNNRLQALTVSAGSLNPTFNPNTSAYTVNVASGITSVRITPRPSDSAATMTVTSNGQVTTSGQTRTVTLRDAGLSTTINITVTAQNGSQKPYLITVDRAAPPPPSGNNNLRSLTVSSGTLDPTFNSNTTNYGVEVGSGVGEIRVTPTLSDSAATMTVNGQSTNSGQARTITLRAAGLSTTINIAVRAPNGSQNPYTIIVDRTAPPPPSDNNNLQNLVVSPGALNPEFRVNRTGYTVNVGSDVDALTLTATTQDPEATLAINGQEIGSGQPRTVSLREAGLTTEINITVSAPNRNPKPYQIDVNRAAPAEPPPAPASAPDLISADDSCLLIPGTNDCDLKSDTTRDDNLTHVIQPRFRVPPPSQGETPNLYVDGNKVESSFNASNNTLRPDVPLSASDLGTEHSITSTVTNSGTNLESDQSPSLTVIINTGAPGMPSGGGPGPSGGGGGSTP
jgi:hypothetical protein